MFYGCKNLVKLPDISKWKPKKLKNIECLFGECSSLEEISDISNWDISETKCLALFIFL